MYDFRTSKELWKVRKDRNGGGYPFWTTDLWTHFFLGQIFCKSIKRSLGGIHMISEPPKNCGMCGRIEMEVVTHFGQLTFERNFFWGQIIWNERQPLTRTDRLLVPSFICICLELSFERTRAWKRNLRRQFEPKFAWLSPQPDAVKFRAQLSALWWKDWNHFDAKPRLCDRAATLSFSLCLIRYDPLFRSVYSSSVLTVSSALYRSPTLCYTYPHQIHTPSYILACI